MSALSIGGNGMAIQRFKHFLWKEKHIFCGFVKSEVETAKTQLKSCQKKGFFESQRSDFFLISFSVYGSDDHVIQYKSCFMERKTHFFVIL